MSKENVRLFFDALAEDTALQRKFNDVNARLAEELNGEPLGEERFEEIFQEEFLPELREKGLDFSFSELKEYAGESSNGALADEELAAVAAGVKCVCVFAGMGEHQGISFACPVAGVVMGGGITCVCFVGGGGT